MCKVPKQGKIGHLQTCHLGIRVIFSQRQLRRSSRYKKSCLPSPICLKAGDNIQRCLLLPSLPGRVEVNHQRIPITNLTN